ncbi:hypothetical protein GT037_003249 [Alternaria burnsii]|uniref:Methyltransferase domain-containing protein n=1 Tax=Alternaria burnsii TaxID=1187904 RepID=A0A8H7B901_9PLEO|nr:uncharacterized protein GT037_003249 [Alternaria burnsii]KAF7679501.1 hypothetical protein GT037_003249 [Alternaria burnsii]
MAMVEAISDPVAAKKPSKDYPWWVENIDHKITPEVRQHLETYSGIQSGDVYKHIYTIREKAWSIGPYPCTGIGMFLSPAVSCHPAYKALLPRLKASGKFLDIGCYIGQDLRRLALDGVPEQNLIGTDIVDHWKLGFEFFNDKDRFHAQYIESDLLHPNGAMERLFGQIDVVSIIHVLHQWDWNTQILACKEVAKFTKTGSVIIGYQGGTNDITKRTKWNVENGQKEFTLHDPKTFMDMWRIVGEEMEMEWSTEAKIVPWDELATRTEDVAYLGEDFALLRFLVKRVR